MDKETLHKALELSGNINTLKEFDSEGSFEIKFRVKISGEHSMEIRKGEHIFFESEDDDKEYIIALKSSIADFLDKKLKKWQEEFDRL